MKKNTLKLLMRVVVFVVVFEMPLFSMESEIQGARSTEINFKAKANLNCAEMLLKGHGIAQDYAQARRRLELVVEQECAYEVKAQAYWLLAKIYYFGHGVDANKMKMSSYIEKACVAAAFTDRAQEMNEVATLLRNEKSCFEPRADEFGMTQLHECALKGNCFVADMLIDKGCDVNCINVYGRTPLHMAACNGHTQVAELLLEERADVHLRCKKGETPLHVASEKGHKDLATLLVSHRADLNARDTDAHGWTPLERAFLKRHNSLVAMLISKGSNLLLNDLAGSCFLDKAVTLVSDDEFKNLFTQGALLEEQKSPCRTFLHWAAEKGREDLVEIALNNGPDIDGVDEQGRTPLQRAVEIGSIPVTQLLLDNDATVNVVDLRGRTPLHFASAGQEDDVLARKLIASRAAVDARDQDSRTPLYYASEKGNAHVVKLLLEHCADANAVDKKGETILQAGPSSWNPKVVRLLIEHGADIEAREVVVRSYGDSYLTRGPLHKAAMRGRKDIVELLLTQRASADEKDCDGATPLQLALEMGYHEVVKALLDAGARFDIRDSEGVSYLEKAVSKGSPALVSVLLSHDPRQKLVNNQGKSLLYDVTNKKTAEILIAHGAVVNMVDKEQNATPLHSAACCGRMEVVEVLLDNYANINSQTVCGFTPLLCAINEGLKSSEVKFLRPSSFDSRFGYYKLLTSFHCSVVKLLLARGADFRLRDHKGLTALHWAAKRNRKEIVKILLPKHADIDAVDKNGSTALHKAARRGYQVVVEMLLNFGAETNVMDNNGETPLHRAAAHGHAACVQLLLTRGADNRAVNKEGLTPFHVAASKGQRSVVEAFLGVNYCSEYYLQLKLLQDNAKKFLNKDELELFTGLSKDRHKDGIKLLRDRLTRINDGGTERRKFENAYKKVVDSVLNYTVDVNLRDGRGLTALHHASKHGHYGIVELLIEYGAFDDKARSLLAVVSKAKEGAQVSKDMYDVQKKIDDELLYCTAHGFIRTDLIEKGASVNAHWYDDITVLMYASASSLLPFCKYLCENGARIHDKDNEGCNALMWAAGKNNNYRHSEDTNVCEFLVKAGIDINEKSSSGKTALMFAAAAGNALLVDWLIRHNADAHACDNNLCSALLHALTEWKDHPWKNNDRSYEKTCRTLIEAGVNVNQKDNAGRFPLLAAIENKSVEICELLLAKKACIDLKNEYSETILMKAVSSQNYEICKLVLAAGANVNEIDKNGDSALSDAVCYAAGSEPDSSSYKIVVLLLEQGARPNSKALFFSASGGNIELCELLIVNGALVDDSDKRGYTAFHGAALEGKTEVCKYLACKGADVHKKTLAGETALMLATGGYCAFAETAEYLIGCGGDVRAVNNEGDSALLMAIRKGFSAESPCHGEVLKLFLRSDILDITAGEFAGLCCDEDLIGAAFYGLYEVCEFFVKHRNVNVNICDENGRTPLVVAKDLKTVEMLLTLGADINIKDGGSSLLHLAVYRDEPDICELLIKKGLDVNIRDGYGNTPLISAAISGKKEVCERLILYKPDLEIIRGERSTDDCLNPLVAAISTEHEEIYFLLVDAGASREKAFFLAAESGHSEVCEFLLDRGVGLEAKDESNGFTALQYARRAGKNEIVNLLLVKGADDSEVSKNPTSPVVKKQAPSTGTLNAVPLASGERLGTLRKIKGPKHRPPTKPTQPAAVVLRQELTIDESEVDDPALVPSVNKPKKGGIALINAADLRKSKQFAQQQSKNGSQQDYKEKK